jgi:hypothetical protein
MTPLKDKIQDSLDETRMLVLGSEILVGFEFTAHFQDGFSDLPEISGIANTAGLGLMLIVISFLLAPCAFHQFAARGEDSASVHRFTTRIMTCALLPFAVALGFTLYIPAERIAGHVAASALALAVIVFAGILWYGPAMLNKERENMRSSSGMGSTSIHDKIRQALTEARVIIPGNQALLGFQFAVILQRGFTALAMWLQWIHLISLGFITISTLLLMTPAAFHRLAEHGEETPRFYRVAHLMVLLSLPPLALGVCGDFFIVLFKVSNNSRISVAGGGLMLSLFLGMWFVYPAIWRSRRRTLRQTGFELKEQM